jgi:Tfp pilus assembly protein PilZ
MTISMLKAKVVNLSDARDQMNRAGVNAMNESAERRMEQRLARQDRLFAQITSCAETDLVGTTFSCYTQDVSAGGLCITSEAYIPSDAKLDLWVENSSRPGKYFLTSDVRWVAPMQGSQCAVGLELQPSPTTDIELWRQDHH